WASGLIWGGNLTLTAGGGIGSDTTHSLKIDSGRLAPGASAPEVPLNVTATANGAVYLEETAGDLWLNQLITTGAAWVKVDSGSLYDANTTEVRDDRDYDTLKAGLWSELNLTSSSRVTDAINGFVAGHESEYASYWNYRIAQGAQDQVGLNAGETYYVIVVD